MFKRSKEEIIQIVGDALKDGNGGSIGVYPNTRRISFYDRVDQRQINELRGSVNKLYDIVNGIISNVNKIDELEKAKKVLIENGYEISD